MDLTPLPGRSQPFLPNGGLDARMGVRDAQRRSFNPPGLQFPEKGPPGVLRFVEHWLHGQDFPSSGLRDPVSDHQGHRNDLAVDLDLVIQRIDPEERIFGLRRPVSEGIRLLGELLVDVLDLTGRDVFDAHGLGQALDFPGRDAVDKRFLDDGDQGLLGSAPLRDENKT